VVSFVDNATFSLVKTDDYNDTVLVGSRVHFQLTITFPPGTTDLVVELFTPNDTLVMTLCSPRVTHVGSNIQYSNADANSSIVMDSVDDTHYVSVHIALRCRVRLRSAETLVR